MAHVGEKLDFVDSSPLLIGALEYILVTLALGDVV